MEYDSGNVANNDGDLAAILSGIFDLESLSDQPDCVLCVSAQEDSLPQKVLELIKSHTSRGALLDSRPLRILGVGLEGGPGEVFELIRGAADRRESVVLLALEEPQFSDFAREVLAIAAGARLLPRPGPIRQRLSNGAGGALVIRFDLRGYSIRPAKNDDLPKLETLERSCWLPGLQASPEVLVSRLRNWPAGQLVIAVGDQIMGCVYSQKIRDIRELDGTCADDVGRLHDDAGSIVQLLALNVMPGAQNQHLGGQLLEYILQYSSTIPRVHTVVGVTRCKSYHGRESGDLESYIRLRNEYHQHVDPILAMHESRGAGICRLVPGYRPNDIQNDGNGVLVRYDLQRREQLGTGLQSGEDKHAAGLEGPQLREYFEEKVARLARIDRQALDSAQPLMELGLDSADLLALGEQISADFRIKLSPLFFFQHDTCEKVLRQLTREAEIDCSPRVITTDPGESASRHRSAHELSDPNETARSGEVAVIGFACRLPSSIEEPHQLWALLKDGGSAVGKLPADRWQWPPGVDPTSHPGIASGGFMDDIARFDGAFFRISPREAEIMDPQQRILMELSWTCIENAGYAARDLASTKTGVYVGASGSDYKYILGRAGAEIDGHLGLATSMSLLPNRISYFFDFRGPSLQIDTACSSSLVAVHEAIAALRAGRCAQALVGGINVMCEPSLTIAYYRAGMLSKDGVCKTFDNGANGYVRSEGAVMLLLKTRSDAERDGDCIHAVLRGSAVNHGGLTSGITVPSAERQSALLLDAYEDAKVDLSTVDYIEAHGTGTPLGDPIEIQGIRDAFGHARGNGAPTQRCGIGSLKSNLGHLEAAAGIAGLLKVILSLQHEEIPRLRNYRTLNTKIDLGGAPLFIVEDSTRWDIRNETPRRAGVSSFGSGGTNAHVVVEEYRREAAIAVPPTRSELASLIVLSAKTEVALRERASQLLDHLSRNAIADDRLGDIAYTLQVGRDPMEHRLAFQATTAAEVQSNLTSFLNTAELREERRIFTGHSKVHKDALALFNADEDTEELIRRWISKGKYSNLLKLWTKGLSIDWRMVYAARTTRGGEPMPRRLGLPTYPFSRVKHWTTSKCELDSTHHDSWPARAISSETKLHPLLHHNTSDFCTYRYTSAFTGRESFFVDHIVEGREILPAAAYLEMVREAVSRLNARGEYQEDTRRVLLSGVTWITPIGIEDRGVEVHIRLRASETGDIEFEVYSTTADRIAPANILHKDQSQRSAANDVDIVVHARGRASVREIPDAGRIDLEALKAELAVSISEDECYETLAASGLVYGASFRGLASLLRSERAVASTGILACIRLPACAIPTQSSFQFHPTIVDAAIQATVLLAISRESERSAHSVSATGHALPLIIPFAIDSLTIYDALPPHAHAFIKLAGSGAQNAFDIVICDQTGRILASFEHLVIRPSGRESRSTRDMAILRVRAWRECDDAARSWACTDIPRTDSSRDSKVNRQLIVHPQFSSLVPRIRGAFPRARVTQLEISSVDVAASVIASAEQIFVELRKWLADLEGAPALVQIVIPHNPPDLPDGNRMMAREWNSGLDAFSALLKSAELEHPELVGQLLQLDPAEAAESQIASLHDAYDRPEIELHYAGGTCYVPHLLPLSGPPKELTAGTPWCEGGVYVITGGAGALGLLFAREIITSCGDATVVIFGRGALSVQRREHLDSLNGPRGRVEYCIADVNELDEVVRGIQGVLHRHGRINGVMHCAGVISDSLLIKKTTQMFRAVLLPKVTGTLNLDVATSHIKMDFFICFSSIHAELGCAGQTDYALGNAFMDSFVRFRQRQVADGTRFGKALSINWPLWEEGGMRAPEAVEQSLRLHGRRPLPTSVGIAAFYEAFASGDSNVLVAYGDSSILPRTVLANANSSANSVNRRAQGHGEPAPAATLRKTLDTLTLITSQLLNVPLHDIDENAELRDFGFDSMTFAEFGNILHRDYQLDVAPTVFFEHANLISLATHICVHHRDALRRPSLGDAQIASSGNALATDSLDSESIGASPFDGAEATESKAPRDEDTMPSIAIIGMTGRFPGADDVESFWDNLRAGKDCVTEVPPHRWNPGECFDTDRTMSGKTNCRWGGFIDHVTEFDCAFFGISPRDAERMDAQERLFLETVSDLLERSGYTRESSHRLLGGNVGIYVGSMYGNQATKRGTSALNNEPFTRCDIANRASYHFGFHGPSMLIDTMCSSAATALHIACNDLLSGNCQAAVVGGVNLSDSAEKYIRLSERQLLCGDPDCRSFGVGDGYIPAESVGAVLLKPLQRAVADQDSILAVVRATAVSHSGQSNGYWLPNIAAQSQLIAKVLDKAGIEAKAISYIEAAASGSGAADATEIGALTRVFAGEGVFTRCPIGSVKLNIGHAEGASAISQLVKVILQLTHQVLPPSIKLERLNPGLAMESTPFFFERTARDWSRDPEETRGAPTSPRRVLINSFGAGGSYATMIIEEYLAQSELRLPEESKEQIFVVSAHIPQELAAAAKRLLFHRQLHTGQSLSDIAFTLQVGREAMECRLAFVARTSSEMLRCLQTFLAHVDCRALDDPSIIYLGEMTGRRNGTGRAPSVTLDESHAARLYESDPHSLAHMWTQGSDIAWHRLPRTTHLRRVPLPSYPFSRSTVLRAPAGALAHAEGLDAAEADSGATILSRVIDVVCAELRIKKYELDSDVDLANYGLESMSRLRIALQLGKTFALTLAGRVMVEHRSVRAMAMLVERLMDARDSQSAPRAAAAAAASTQNREPASLSTPSTRDAAAMQSVAPLVAFKQDSLSLEHLKKLIAQGVSL